MIQETNLKPYLIYNSENHRFPLVVSIPHSGTQLTREMQETFLPDVVLSNMDWYLPQLYAFLVEWGVTVLVNPISRYVIDPNRPPFQKIGDAYTTNCIYETTTSGEPMYAAPLTEAVRLERKHCYYDAYHQALKQLLAEKKQRFSKVYLLDLHSYGMDTGSDAIIGTQFGQTCSAAYSTALRTLLEQEGLRIAENQPFAGGYLTKHYGADTQIEAAQIELSYAYYIDHRTFGREAFPEICPAVFADAQQHLQSFFKNLLKEQITCQ